MLRSVILSTITSLAITATGVAQSLPTNFVSDTLIASGLQAGHDFSFLPDGRVVIANRGGLVQVWAGAGSPVAIGTVSGVETGSERGLLSIEADPNMCIYCFLRLRIHGGTRRANTLKILWASGMPSR